MGKVMLESVSLFKLYVFKGLFHDNKITIPLSILEITLATSKGF